MSNTLKKESSIYLQQHANDPIHWKTWSDELLEKAKKEQKRRQRRQLLHRDAQTDPRKRPMNETY